MPPEKNKFYSKQDLRALFLVGAFPLHLWTLLLAFRDLSWVAERTNFWDAIGAASYGLVFAFLESLLLFPLTLALGLFVFPKWGGQKRLAIASVSILTLALWSIISQSYALKVWELPPAALQFFAASAHPLRNLYALALVFVVPSAALPVLALLQSEKTLGAVLDFLDRLSLLTMFYLALDAAALVVVVVRNL